MGRQRLPPPELVPDVAASQEDSSLLELYGPTPIGFSWADEVEEAELSQPLPPVDVAPHPCAGTVPQRACTAGLGMGPGVD